MSEIIHRTVTFEPLVRADNPNAKASVGFTIEPPINVHNTRFLRDAVQALGWDNKHADYSIMNDVNVNYSDDRGTYGVVRVGAYTQPEVFQSLIERSFVPALSLGGKTVEIVFKSEA